MKLLLTIAVLSAAAGLANAAELDFLRVSDDRRGFGDAAGSALDLARGCAAQAAVLWYGEEDEVRVWSLPQVRDALSQAGLPLLVMTRRDEAARDGAPGEIRQFLEGLKS